MPGPRSRRIPIGLIYSQTARNGDRVALTRVGPTISHGEGRTPAHYVVTLNGHAVCQPRTKDEGMREVTKLLAARQHGE